MKPLTRREIQILKALVLHGNAELAARDLGLSVFTVKASLGFIRLKLGLVGEPLITIIVKLHQQGVLDIRDLPVRLRR